MNVDEIMSEQPVCVAPETDIVNAAARMKDHELGALPACEKGRLVGMIAQGDWPATRASGYRRSSHKGPMELLQR